MSHKKSSKSSHIAWSRHAYIQSDEASSTPDKTLLAAVYAHDIILSKNPRVHPVLTLKHLSMVAGVPYTFLRLVVERKIDPYFDFNIPRHGSGANQKPMRPIAMPHKYLRDVQSWIAINVLNAEPPSTTSYAYHPGSSIWSCAQKHCKSRWLIKIDIKDFFPSIPEFKVYDVFLGMGFQPLVSFEMARLCTRISKSDKYELSSERFPRKIHQYTSQYSGSLPMGAPSSPALSNLVMRSFDNTLNCYALSRNLVYSRYADDIFISSHSKVFGRLSALYVTNKVAGLLSDNDFYINHSKLRMVPPGARKIILGLGVNSETPKLTKKFKAKLRQHYYYIFKHGVTHHAERTGFNSALLLCRHVEGLLNYAAQIEPDYADRMRLEFHSKITWPPLLIIRD